MSPKQRLVLIISILASFVAFLDGSVVNVALPSISRSLGGGLATQQWVVDAYLLSLGSLILLAGSLSDLFGRKRVLTAGLMGFMATSLLCAIAPSNVFLIVARGMQGIAGALLVPSSLALIISNFSGREQGKAIGSWTAWTGISFICGPLLGGFLVDQFSWRLIFAINVLPIAICLWLLRSLDAPEKTKHVKVDVVGALMCSAGLCLTVFSLIEQPNHGWSSALILIPLVIGISLLTGFVYYEGHHDAPMLPLSLFNIHNFRVGNIATVAVYGALSVSTFIIVIFLQQVSGYSAFHAGLALLPTTIIMFSLSPRFGALSGKYGPRLFMSIGPMLSACGFLLMLRVSSHVHYVSQLLPGILVFGIGLTMTVAPLTSAILGDIEPKYAGIASAVNNAVSRIAGLIAIAMVGVITGSKLSLSGFHHVIEIIAIVIALGGVISGIGIQNRQNNKPS
jgi:EmrB/QacA subfamily drug resistance transporter